MCQKLLQKSNLKKKADHLYLEHAGIISWAVTVLSKMDLARRKDEWEGSIKALILALSLHARTLEMIF